MAASINRPVASRVFRSHRVSKGVSVTVKLLRVAKRPSFCRYIFFFTIWPTHVLMGGNCRRKSILQFPLITVDGEHSTVSNKQNANWPNNKKNCKDRKKAVLGRAAT